MTETRNPFPSCAVSAAACAATSGVAGAPGGRTGLTADCTPISAPTSAVVASTGSAIAGSVGDTPSTTSDTVGPLVDAAFRIARPSVDSLVTEGSPAVSRPNRPSPKTPSAAANPATVAITQISTIRPAWCAMNRPRRASIRRW